MINVINWAANYLAGNNPVPSRAEAEFLLSGFLDCPTIDLYLNRNGLDKKQKEAFRTLVEERKKGVPRQILLGRTQFMDWTFLVQKGVFIPRPETEILVETAFQIIERFPLTPGERILDLGTGSGIIAISLLKMFPGVKVYATDISERALSLAEKNAKVLGVNGRIKFRQGNLFSAFKKSDFLKSFCLIVANLPYIPTGELSGLPIEVKKFDPVQSLDGGGDGFCLYRNLFFQAGFYLKKRGFLVIEIGRGQLNLVKDILTQNEKLEFIKVIQDYRGEDRVVVIRGT